MREWTIGELHEAYDNGTTPLEICGNYLDRIESIDRTGPAINAIIEVNPDARAIAESLHEELAARRDSEARRELFAQKPLFGVPVLLKDNIDTGDRMKTTAGSLALADAVTPTDAPVVTRLREAGALILGKTNLSEWANFRSSNSNSGWSSRGGQTRNPYVLDRTPCGSSSGSGAAIAANVAVVAVGTETDGSITCPAAHNSLVGLKPTIGTVSRTGIIPISASQDTAGPMARTVTDAAILYGVLAGHDAEDPASLPGSFFTALDVHAPLRPDALRGARLGVARTLVSLRRGADQSFTRALEALADAGAVIVDDADLPDLDEAREHELTVLLYEFRQGLADYFARRDDPKIRTIDDVIAFNREHADTVLRLFGQEHMERAAGCGPLTEERYVKARAESVRMAGTDGLFALLDRMELDALIAPTNGAAWLIDHVNGDYYTGGGMSTAPAISGAPHLTVPSGYHHGLPMGLSIAGRPGHDARLLGIGYAIEQIIAARRPPEFIPSVGLM